MKTKLFFGTLIAASLFTACSNEDKMDSTTTANLKADNKSDLAILQNEALNNLKQRYDFVVNDRERQNIRYTSPNGTVVTLDASQLKLNGKPVRGRVTLEFAEIYNSSDMITTNMATMGLLENSDAGAAPMVSGGEIFVNVTQEGQDLDDGTPVEVVVPTEATGGGEEEMLGWNGTEDEDGDTKWEKDEDAQGNDTQIPDDGGKYVLNLEGFGWYNIDKFVQFGNGAPLTDFFVDVPAGYDNNNSKVYLIYQGIQNMAGQMDHYDPGTELFYTPPAYIPTGLTIHVIFLSGSAGNWEIAVQTVTVSTSQTVVINQSDINPATQADITNIINYLP